MIQTSVTSSDAMSDRGKNLTGSAGTHWLVEGAHLLRREKPVSGWRPWWPVTISHPPLYRTTTISRVGERKILVELKSQKRQWCCSSVLSQFVLFSFPTFFIFRGYFFLSFILSFCFGRPNLNAGQTIPLANSIQCAGNLQPAVKNGERRKRARQTWLMKDDWLRVAQLKWVPVK